MVRVLSDADVAAVLDLSTLLDVVAEAFRKQAAGEVERPERPHFLVGRGLDPENPEKSAGTGLAMPAYVYGRNYYATKLASVHEGNAERGLTTVNAQIALNEAKTGLPAAYMDGTRITNARTGAIGGLAARALADEPVTLGVLGAGTQARWQTRAVAAATDLREVRFYSPSESRKQCAEDMGAELDVDTRAVSAPADAVEGASVVVTATTAREPVFPAEALAPNAVVVAVGAYTAEMQELESEVFERADRLFADVPEEVAEIGDALAAGLEARDFRPFAELLEEGRKGDEIVVVESVGTAVLDAVTAEYVYENAVEREIGHEVELSN